MGASQPQLLPTQTIKGPESLVPCSSSFRTQVGPDIYVFAEDVYASYNLERTALRWTASLPGRPEHRSRARRITHALWYEPRVYESLGLVVHLHPCDDAGMWVLAYDLMTGRHVWTSKIELPAAEAWTEPRQAHESLDTEELRALLVNRDDHIAVCLIRNSRRASAWLADGRHFPAPPWSGGLDMYEFDLAGRLVRRVLLPAGRLGYYGERSFDGLHVNEHRICDFDWNTGREMPLLDLPGTPAYPIRVGGRIIGAWHDGRRTGAISFLAAQPDACSQVQLPSTRSPVDECVLYPVADGALLRFNQARLLRIEHDARVRYEAKVKPYVYEVAGGGELPLLIGCDGKGTNFYAFDDRRGELLCHEPKPGNPRLLPLLGGDWVVAAQADRVVTLSADGRRTSVLRADRELDVAGSFGRTLWSCLPRGDARGVSLDITTLRLPD